MKKEINAAKETLRDFTRALAVVTVFASAALARLPLPAPPATDKHPFTFEDIMADEFKTPTLVVHGQNDYRLDVSQGFDLFTTLQRLNVPSKMLYFPNKGQLGAQAAELAALVQDGERLGGSVV